MRKRAALLAQVQNTNRQDTRPESGQPIASKAHRHGVADRCAAPAGHQSLASDWALLPSDAQLLNDVALSMGKAAKPHDAHTLSLLQPVPGLGKLLSLGLRYAMHDMARFPTGQDLVSSCRLVRGAKESAGTRVGTSGNKIGHAHLQWAFAAAAAVCLRHNPAGHHSVARVENKHGQGTAVTIRAPKLARAV